MPVLFSGMRKHSSEIIFWYESGRVKTSFAMALGAVANSSDKLLLAMTKILFVAIALE